jgi:hypothetical protein
MINAAITVTCTFIALVRWRGVQLDAALAAALNAEPRAAVGAALYIDSHVPDSILDDDVDRVVSNDPFRLSNAPSRVAFDDAAEASPPTGFAIQRSLRPNLVLKAIVGGPPWQAIIDGLPGQSAGAIAAQGAVFDQLVIRSVARDRVIVHAPDTTWVLTFGGAP